MPSETLGQLVARLDVGRRRRGRPTPASPPARGRRSWSPPRARSAPSGQVRPGQTAALSPRRLQVPGVTRDIVSDARHNAVRRSVAVRGRAVEPIGRARPRRAQTSEEAPWRSSYGSRSADGVGTIRLDRPKMNALNVQMQEEIRAAAAEATARDDVKAVVVYGGERVFAAGADVKEMADMSYADMVQRSGRAPVGAHQRRAHPEAGRRRDHRLRARRRLRAGAVRRRPLRRRGRRPRPARDPARHHPRRRRHPAADPPGRPEPGQGHHLHRSVREGRRGAGDRPGRPRRTRRPGVRRGAWRGRVGSRDAATYALRAAKESIDLGLEVDLDTGLAIERQQFAALFATEDRTIGMTSFVENGPGKAEFKGR